MYVKETVEPNSLLLKPARRDEGSTLAMLDNQYPCTSGKALRNNSEGILVTRAAGEANKLNSQRRCHKDFCNLQYTRIFAFWQLKLFRSLNEGMNTLSAAVESSGDAEWRQCKNRVPLAHAACAPYCDQEGLEVAL